MSLLKRLAFDKTTLRDSLGLAFVAAIVRIPGLFWGFHLLTTGPFIFFSYDEISVSHDLPVWVTHPEFLRKDYLKGFFREMAIMLSTMNGVGIDASQFNILMGIRVMNILFSVGTVVVIYRLAQLLFNADGQGNRAPALIAGAMLAFAPLHVANSHYATPLTSFVFWSYLAIYGFISYRQTDRPAPFFLGCAATGIAIAVKFGAQSLIPLVYLLICVRRKYLIKISGVLLTLAAFYYFNIGELPWKNINAMRSVLINDNFFEREHARWFNPVLFAITLVPSLGLPTFLALVAGIRHFWNRERGERGINRRDRFFLLELPLLVYFIAICTMTSVFTRHLVFLLPYLCLIAAAGMIRTVEALSERGKRGVGLTLLAIAASYQLVSVAWLERQHVVNRVIQGLDWVYDNMPAGKKIYIAERTEYDVSWKHDVPEDLKTGSFDEADYLFITEKITWRFKRSNLTPLSTSPTDREIYHHRFIKDPERIRELMAGKAPFERVAHFPAFEIIPEFILYKAVFNSFNIEHGDVSIYKRTSG